MTSANAVRSGPIHHLKIESHPVGDLRTYHRNPRRGNTTAIAQSLVVNGQYRPIVVNRGTHTGRPNEVLAGNHTLIAARDNGWHELAVCFVDVDDDQAARIVVADNRIADLGEYDNDALSSLLAEIGELDGTGYADSDLAAMLAPDNDELDDDDAAAAADGTPGYGVFPLDDIIEAAAQHIEASGPPLPEPLPVYRSMIEINRLRASESDALKRSAFGYRVADTYQIHRFAVHVEDRKTVWDVCADPHFLRAGVRFALESGKDTPAGIRSTLGITRGAQVAANFRPGYALTIYRRFAPRDGTMLDTSTGFGGRLVAFMASDLQRYIGIDPNPLTHKANERMAAELGFADRVELINLPAEDVDTATLAGRADFAFTSPPYFNKERYAEDDTQSCVRYPEAEQWRTGFLVPLLELQAAALKRDAYNVINIADVTTRQGKVVPLVQWTIDAALDAGFSHVDTEELPLDRAPGRHADTRTGGATGEPVLIFRRT